MLVQAGACPRHLVDLRGKPESPALTPLGGRGVDKGCVRVALHLSWAASGLQEGAWEPGVFPYCSGDFTGSSFEVVSVTQWG